MGDAPRVLIFGTRDWIGISRLPGALARAGFDVAILAPRNAHIAHSRFVERCYLYEPSERSPDQEDFASVTARIFRSLVAAIESCGPRLVIPADEDAVTLLRLLPGSGTGGPPVEISAAALDVMRRSIGAPWLCGVSRNRQLAMTLARRHAIPAPVQAVLMTIEDGLDLAGRCGYPIVLKTEGSVAGAGIRLCRDEDELRRELHSLLARCARHSAPPPIGQQFIAGRTAMRSVAAVAGAELAGISALKERVHPEPFGPSSVVRSIDDPGMAEASRKCAAALELTGFASFDFMLGAADGRAYLIEINPRPSPIIHLGALWGSDLCGALHAGLVGVAYRASPADPSCQVVALYPNEQARDPDSPYLTSAFHDVPRDDPELAASLARTLP